MCGIAGFVQWRSDSTTADVKAIVKRMSGAMVHRGPDDDGIFISRAGIAAVASRRLAIIDISATGHQPMPDATGRYWIVFNGEIYNFRECREDLVRDGYPFRSKSDTEVVVALYAQEGAKALDRLRGMFAFAIWDDVEQSLFLARDRFGIKPLYYYSGAGAFAFASEVRAIHAAGVTSREIDPESLSLFLAWGSIPEPKTILQRVHALRAGHFMKVDSSGSTAQVYWDLPYAFERWEMPRKPTGAEVEEVREALRGSIRAHMVSDVPVGLFLSGGLDSTALLAFMSESGGSDIKTFSVVFGGADDKISEGRFARLAADFYGTDHHEVFVTAQRMLEEWDTFFSAMDQPTVDGVNTYFVARAAHEGGIKVVISGLGGDELFGGYSTFTQVPRIRRFLMMANRLRLNRAVMRCVALLQPSRLPKLREALRSGWKFDQVYFYVRGLFMPEEVTDLVGASGTLIVNPLRYLKTPLVGTGDHIRMQILETACYLRNQLLRDSDMFGMANSIEVRVPYVDHELLQVVGRTPTGSRHFKELLAWAVAERIPTEVLRRRKATFTFPLGHWLREIARPRLEQALSNPPQLENSAVDRIKRQFFEQGAHWCRVWSLVALSEYLRMNGLRMPMDS